MELQSVSKMNLKPVSVRIVKIWPACAAEDNEKAKVVPVTLADQSDVRIAFFSENHVKQLSVDKGLRIENYTVDPYGRLKVANVSTVARVKPPLISDQHLEIAMDKQIDSFTMISEILTKDPEQRPLFNVKGTVIADTELKELASGSKREITIEDESGVIDCTLWKGSCKSPVKIGDFVSVKKARLGFWRRKKLDINESETILTIIERPSVVKDIDIEGVISLSAKTCNLLCSSVTYELDTPILLNFLQVAKFDEDLIETILLDAIPIKVQATINGGKLVGLVDQGAHAIPVPAPTPIGMSDNEASAATTQTKKDEIQETKKDKLQSIGGRGRKT